MAEIHVSRGEAEAAIELLTVDLESAWDNASAWFHLGIAYRMKGDLKLAEDGRYLEATALAKRAHELNRDWAESLLRPDPPIRD
ncbi:MAG: hypothetical protein HY698_21810 [Deltaproteobacteria bacterium]|nr:hypothetical protein [Deltaproteobacteria bacterium]